MVISPIMVDHALVALGPAPAGWRSHFRNSPQQPALFVCKTTTKPEERGEARGDVGQGGGGENAGEAQNPGAEVGQGHVEGEHVGDAQQRGVQRLAQHIERGT